MTGTLKRAMKTSFTCPYTMFDWGDYCSDTDYLDFEDHGIYWNLLRRYYTTGPFENDMKILQRVTRCPKNKVTAMQSILEEFFFVMEEDGCWHHKRCDEEIMRAKHTSEVQSRKARIGAAKRRRDSETGLFLPDDCLPATAGTSPANKEEELISRSDKDEEQELIKTLRIKYKDEYKDLINEEYKEGLIAKEIEKDIKQWALEKVRRKLQKL